MGNRAVRGNTYKRQVGAYITAVYGPRGLSVFDEVGVGTSIVGKQRRVDLLVLQQAGAIPGSGDQLSLPGVAGARYTERALAIECKYQDSSGTADEKIPYALQDLGALRMSAVIVYAGAGFSEGVLHLLKSSHLAAYCLPDETGRPIGRKTGDPVDSGTWQLDHILAMTFGFWDVLLGARKPIGA